ncbi:acyl-CoA dehydrogenase family protein [Paracoccus aminophilus]|uniref:Dibenzothiophene monooxygenase n=1 Tax=Paracoccus aminophilus JCM 7686 TaxID=1367847 RepID=S5XYE7_PARAH|nr:acyl-CoA dehydrogenase family protein [Paracoccus aminophilus]AGT08460.1 acyl-CoA dehydrogenase [Paracoccus aminophilus JCM 7686]
MAHFIDALPPTPRYEAIAGPFRPFLERVRAEAVLREDSHRLLHPEIAEANRLGLTRLRLSEAQGGLGLDLVEFFAVVIELGAADPNLANALRAQAGTIEEVVTQPDGEWSDFVIAELGSGKLAGSGASEVGGATNRSYETELRPDGAGYLLNGRKYYTTGGLYAQYLNTFALTPEGKTVAMMVPTDAPGVTVLDDWDGFGQQLSASGTAIFENVHVRPEWVRPFPDRFPHALGFFQLYHIATLAGIARTIAQETSDLVTARTRSYLGRSNTERSADDPQVLQVLGRLASIAYVTRAAVLQAATGLQAVYAESLTTTDPARRDALSGIGELHVSQTVTVVTDLVLEAATVLFDTLGASAAKKGYGLDRHWRNARTLASHNPRIFHDRNIGTYAARGVLPETFLPRASDPAVRKFPVVANG